MPRINAAPHDIEYVWARQFNSGYDDPESPSGLTDTGNGQAITGGVSISDNTCSTVEAKAAGLHTIMCEVRFGALAAGTDVTAGLITMFSWAGIFGRRDKRDGTGSRRGNNLCIHDIIVSAGDGLIHPINGGGTGVINTHFTTGGQAPLASEFTISGDGSGTFKIEVSVDNGPSGSASLLLFKDDRAAASNGIKKVSNAVGLATSTTYKLPIVLSCNDPDGTPYERRFKAQLKWTSVNTITAGIVRFVFLVSEC